MTDFNGSTTLTNNLHSYRTVYQLVFIVLSVLIAVCNATVLLLYYTNRRMRSVKNLLLASLASSDLFAGVIVLPLTLSCFYDADWDVCVASAILFRFLAHSTMLHILVIIYEKYMSILHPFVVMQKKHLRVASACIWCTSFIVAILPLAWLSDGSSRNPGLVQKELIYFLMTFTSFFAIPLLLIVFAQVRMFKAISRSFTAVASPPTTPVESDTPLSYRGLGKPTTSTSFHVGRASRTSPVHNRKVLTAFALMLGTFTICWLTWYIGVLLSYVDMEDFLWFSANLKQIPHILVFLPPLINPLLYTYFKHDFRQALQTLFKTSLKLLCH